MKIMANCRAATACRSRSAPTPRTSNVNGTVRPRIHTGIIEEVIKDEEIAKKCAELGAGMDVESVERQQKRARELDKLAESIGLSDERFTQFKRVVVAFRREPTIENYLKIRREFSEVEIQVSHFGGLESLFALEDKFRAQGIDPHLISAAFDADEPAIDALSLRLLELLAERRKLPTNGPGHIEQRRNAISDSMVNYLILEMLEAIDWNDVEVKAPGPGAIHGDTCLWGCIGCITTTVPPDARFAGTGYPCNWWLDTSQVG